MLDVGSNTVHLLVVDAHHGAHPWPMHSQKEQLNLAQQLTDDGSLSEAGADALVKSCLAARQAVEQHAVDEVLAFATSAVRGATNSESVLGRVRREAGVDLRVLSGEDEARLTFLAAHRWFGWSAGRLLVMDIGGGSLEIAAGADEDPSVAFSLPLGAGRLTRDWLTGDPPSPKELGSLEAHIDSLLTAERVEHDLAAATSKNFRTLARLAGAAPSGKGPWEPRVLNRSGLHQVLGFIRRMPAASLAELDGVSASRAPQLVAGAMVAERAMRRLGVDELRICPWALREGIILSRLDQLG